MAPAAASPTRPWTALISVRVSRRRARQSGDRSRSSWSGPGRRRDRAAAVPPRRLADPPGRLAGRGLPGPRSRPPGTVVRPGVAVRPSGCGGSSSTTCSPCAGFEPWIEVKPCVAISGRHRRHAGLPEPRVKDRPGEHGPGPAPSGEDRARSRRGALRGRHRGSEGPGRTGRAEARPVRGDRRVRLLRRTATSATWSTGFSTPASPAFAASCPRCTRATVWSQPISACGQGRCCTGGSRCTTPSSPTWRPAGCCCANW